MGVPFDHAVSALIEDIHQRGLENDILLVCCGEMGRTPKINNRGGRDHWGNLSPLLLSGGGLNMGQVIGQSKRDGSEPLSEPLTIKHLLSTILHTQFHVGDLRLLGEAVADDIVEPARAHLIPGFLEVKAACQEAGAIACSISGAGPTTFALADDDRRASVLLGIMRELFTQAGVPGEGHIDRVGKGAQVVSDPLH